MPKDMESSYTTLLVLTGFMLVFTLIAFPFLLLLRQTYYQKDGSQVLITRFCSVLLNWGSPILLCLYLLTMAIVSSFSKKAVGCWTWVKGVLAVGEGVLFIIVMSNVKSPSSTIWESFSTIEQGYFDNNAHYIVSLIIYLIFG